MAINVTEATFEQEVLQSGTAVLVDFWAEWCGPCRMVAPEMEKLAEKYNGAVQVVKVDVDANPMLSQAFNIMSIPNTGDSTSSARKKAAVKMPTSTAETSAPAPKASSSAR